MISPRTHILNLGSKVSAIITLLIASSVSETRCSTLGVHDLTKTPTLPEIGSLYHLYINISQFPFNTNKSRRRNYTTSANFNYGRKVHCSWPRHSKLYLRCCKLYTCPAWSPSNSLWCYSLRLRWWGWLQCSATYSGLYSFAGNLFLASDDRTLPCTWLPLL